MGRTGLGQHGEFHPDFPAASPFVTAVGGTDFVTKSTIGPEKAWTDGGGGFSNTFPIPAWQAEAVAAFKKNSGAKLPPQDLWNNTGRGYPDVSALAGEVNPYCIAAGDMLMGIAGTSAATPVVSAIFSRLNALRLAKGGKPMGFLNPWIYQNSDAFHDVTSGKNTGGGFNNNNGFEAITGWDAASGWGTPNFAEMAKRI